MDHDALDQRMELAEIDAICRVKFAYLRLLDLKEFSELGRLLTPDCTAAYDNGNLSFDGRDAIIGFLNDALGDPGIVTKHHCHHPEITFDPALDLDPAQASAPALDPARDPASGATAKAASGIWYLEDRVIIPAADLEIAGTALYRDRYEKIDGHWLISHTGYERIFEEHRVHSTMALTKFTSRF